MPNADANASSEREVLPSGREFTLAVEAEAEVEGEVGREFVAVANWASPQRQIEKLAVARAESKWTR